jgi:hypothetical protein
MPKAMSIKPADFPVFGPLDEATRKFALKRFFSYLDNVSGVLRIDRAKLKYSKYGVYEIIERVEKRRVYFHIYYDRDLGELNEGALMCFWILKLHPFKTDPSLTIPSYVLNTKIALCLFMNMVHYVARINKKRVLYNHQMMENTEYAFMFRDLSKEAIMMLAEGFIY